VEDAVEEEGAVVVDATTQAMDSKGVDSSHATTNRNAVRYALRKVMLLMSVGIASMKIMYQMRSLSVLRTIPMMSTRTGTLIPAHLTTLQATWKSYLFMTSTRATTRFTPLAVQV
jgi:hypothetical protein